MEKDKSIMRRGAGIGSLPPEAPLAMAYVPFQKEGSEQFELMEGLERGTLYPGLDLPFMNDFNVAELSKGLSNELSALGFAVHELGLYLDTHPNDKDAFAFFKACVAAQEKKRVEYIQKYGPITQGDSAAFDTYAWLNNPWPWE
jgi:spore coat protein JB